MVFFARLSVFCFPLVGAGSAGSALAARLSEDPLVSVALLEAGGEPPFWASIPAAAPFLQVTDRDWQYRTVPSSKGYQSMENNVCSTKVDEKFP